MQKTEQGIMHYIRHYPEWWAIVQSTADIRQGIRYDMDKIQSSPNGDVVLNLAMEITDCESRILKVEKCLWDVGRTDAKVELLRDVYCYGHHKMRKGQYYKYYHKLAKRLLLEEWDESSADS